VLRDRDTRAISLTTSLSFSIGLVFWLLYGIATTNWPLIGSEMVSIMLTSVIVAMKLRHG
jgi:MtN3 and saliva related transmembrane protein